VALFQTRVLVKLRPSVLDPAGEATKSAANRLGIIGIKTLRVGKVIEISIEAKDEDEAKRKIEILSDRLLANPVIEDWSFEFTKSFIAAENH
tara:strand:- start:96 stop:371 length:276 start_codon:yes stop_codon:yes gene_type:complete